MGKFTYGGIIKVEFDDRLLAHLQIVIGAKARRGESFHFTWRDDPSIGDGRTAVWIHPQCSIGYTFYGSRPITVNPAWIEALAATANSVVGLHVIAEPPEHRPAGESGGAPWERMTADIDGAQE